MLVMIPELGKVFVGGQEEEMKAIREKNQANRKSGMSRGGRRCHIPVLMVGQIGILYNMIVR